MNSKSLRRLAADHGSLHTDGLPPNYLFPPTSSDSDSLTSLDVLLAGPLGTPYASGVWHLHLDIPPTYPAAPPTATFRTRLWHPNIDEATGAVCVETLKRDWRSELRLRDVLVTVSCLLIQPNPASALNEAAGKLAQEDWDGYCRRARLMTSIHAGVPANLVEVVREAQERGEDMDGRAEGEGEVEKEEVGGKIEGKGRGKGKGKGKEKAKVTSVMASKAQRRATEDDAENTRRREPTELGSDESDWIPGPATTRRTNNNNNNILGIKSLPPHSPPKHVFASTLKPTDTKEKQPTRPFPPTSSKHNALSPSTQSSQQRNPTANTPDHLESTQQPSLPTTQPTNQAHLLFKELSYSWEESRILHEADADPDANTGPKKDELRKRLASGEFHDKKRWEVKRFKRARGELARWNRGDFGPRVGIGRL